MKYGQAAWPLLLPLFFNGCVGTNMLGAFTTDNLGVNIQTTPEPVAEVSFSRREGTIQPVYAQGSVPAIAASVQHSGKNLFQSFTAESRSVFAGGNAAVHAAGDDEADNGLIAVSCLKDKPADRSYYTKDQIGTMVFATDTVIGFKIGLPAGAATMPNASLGYKRNEMALAPMFGTDEGCSLEAMKRTANQNLAAAKSALAGKQAAKASPGEIEAATAAVAAAQAVVNAPPNRNYFALYVPSFIAIANSGEAANTEQATNNTLTLHPGFNIAQVFATGKAAEVISLKAKVNGSIGNVAALAADAGSPHSVAFALGGTFQSGVSLTLNAGSGTACSTATGAPPCVSYAVVAGDQNLEGVARKLAAQINGDRSMKDAQVSATATNNVVVLQAPPGRVIDWTGNPSPPSKITLTKVQ